MIEKIKTYKYGYKCIAMLLVFALSLNMLAGCGKSGSVNNTVQDEYKTENTAPDIANAEPGRQCRRRGPFAGKVR